MRVALALPLLLPFPAFAEDIAVPSRVTEATVFPQGAALVREATFSAPAGQHRLILSDMPVRDAQGLRIEAEGVSLGAVTIRDDLTPPRPKEELEAIETAKTEVERLEQAVEAAKDAAWTIRLEAAAAQAQIVFLKGLGSSDGLGSAGIDTLRDMSRMVAEETLLAERRAQEAAIRAREADQAAEDLVDQLKRARQALAALDVEDKERSFLAISVNVPEAVEGSLTLRYVTNEAGWRPVYDFHLDRGAEPALEIGRGAYVNQWTGETWRDVDLALSTVRPTGQTEPGMLFPELVQIVDPDQPPVPMPRAEKQFMGEAAQARDSAAPMAEPVTAVADFDGLSVTYSYPEPVTLAPGADEVRLTLGTIEVTPEVMARAVPLRDQTAYLVASFTNDADEILLPTGQSEFYLDGTFVGLRPTPLIAAGDETDFSFGPIEGLRLKRTVLDRSEGDRGVISRNNRREEVVEIELRNLTGEAWDVRLLDQVPYSEQEDLDVDWTAVPMPSETDVDGERGILAWDLDLAAGETEVVRLTQILTWPTDKVLR